MMKVRKQDQGSVDASTEIPVWPGNSKNFSEPVSQAGNILCLANKKARVAVARSLSKVAICLVERLENQTCLGCIFYSWTDITLIINPLGAAIFCMRDFCR